jgi:hypothetical protein
MSSIVIDKKKFVADFIIEYKNGDEYDISFVFNEFFNKLYDSEDVPETLYDELYLLVEKELVDDDESDAETDDEN